MREVIFVAGEASGDLHAAGVARELRRERPDLQLTGIGGEHMASEGVELIESVERLAVMGFVEVLRHIPQHRALLHRIARRLASGRVALLVLIDYPGFNMKLAERAAAAGVPVLYYITPQVWAWHFSRVHALGKTVSKAAVILPFEEELLRSAGVDATFVGHPLLDRMRAMPRAEDARRALELRPDAPVLALHPGSRAQEIERHLDAFVAIGHELRRRVPALQVVVSLAPTVEIDPSRCPFPLIRSAPLTVLRAADASLCKSGTNTLEAAVAGCPLAIAYRTSRLTYLIGRRLVRIPNIGLVNVVAGREIAPEFVQDGVVPARVADALEPLLDHSSPRRRRMVADLAVVRERLGTPGASQRVAHMASGLAR